MRKYRNVKCERDGYSFDSLRERAYYDELCLRKKAGDIKRFMVKRKFWVCSCDCSLEFCDEKPRKDTESRILFTYTPDFVVDGELVDVKGFITAEFRLKAKILAALGMPIKIVK